MILRIPAGVHKTFLSGCDNLRAHKSPEVVYMIYQAGHQIIPRAPYRPCNGPIEYVFNDLECGLKTCMHEIRTLQDLMRKTQQVFAGLHGFDALFTHCGY